MNKYKVVKVNLRILGKHTSATFEFITVDQAIEKALELYPEAKIMSFQTNVWDLI